MDRPVGTLRRARHPYPAPVVELALALAAQQPVCDVARLLGIAPSVIYRWRGAAGSRVASQPAAAALADLVARCKVHGFSFAIDALREVATSAPQDSPESSAADCRPSNRIAARYVFDARRERASRGVRHRLEAARREIDSRYFSQIDCRMLASTARMSRHHFIRMFSDLYGMSPYRYLLRVRIRAAKRLLLSSRAPIDVIAAGVGFRSGPSLNRAFRQSEGASITAFCQTAPPRTQQAAHG
jgi:AraC-like DNA-binding protein